MPIIDKRWDGKEVKLVYKSGLVAERGDVVETGSGTYTLTGGKAPHHEASSGKVWVKGPNGVEREFHAQVISAEWKEV
jgi:hypothetical protein